LICRYCDVVAFININYSTAYKKREKIHVTCTNGINKRAAVFNTWLGVNWNYKKSTLQLLQLKLHSHRIICASIIPCKIEMSKAASWCKVKEKFASGSVTIFFLYEDLLSFEREISLTAIYLITRKKLYYLCDTSN